MFWVDLLAAPQVRTPACRHEPTNPSCLHLSEAQSSPLRVLSQDDAPPLAACPQALDIEIHLKIIVELVDHEDS